MLTDNLADLIRLKEKELWTHKQTGEQKIPTLRVSDNNNLILLNDLAAKHQLNFVPTLKDDSAAALNNMRMLIRSERIIINPRCKTLIYHLRSAIWNKARNNYARSGDAGHYDAVDSLKYLCRNVNMTKNPYPANYQLANSELPIFSLTNPKEPKTDLERQLSTMFKLNNRRKKGSY